MIFIVALAIIGVASSAYLLHQYRSGALGPGEPHLTVVDGEYADTTSRAA
jgi:hypothetical protein